MTQYAPVVDLSTLNGTNGFRVGGANSGDWNGLFIGPAGDINGDGIDDFVVGSFLASAPGSASGAAYVIFGIAGGAFPANFSLGSLNGANGFRVTGATAADNLGVWVSSAGDVNHDGVDDLIVGAWTADPNGVASGAAYVVYGHAGSFSSSISASSLNGSNGFRLIGSAVGDGAGFNATAAGDVNGDGIDDFIVSASQFPANAGTTYVVFGNASGFAADLNLGTLNGSNGFSLSGSGFSASAGDINGDGFADIIVGSPIDGPHGANSGAAYVVFGSGSGFAANINLSALNGANGFRISGVAAGDSAGYSVSAAGDVNGDGFEDIIIGAPTADPNGSGSGAAYVVFGAAGGFGANIDLSSLNGVNGFKISGTVANANTGISVSNAGDFNGDGFDDVIVTAWLPPPGIGPASASYVVFGKAGGFSSNLTLTSLDGNNGFRLSSPNTTEGAGASVSDAGDINGDGFGDLLVGAPLGSNQTGATYVIFGAAPGEAVTRSGTEIANVIHGGAFNDTLSGLGGSDIIFGGSGDDVIDGGSGADAMSGGAGNDVYSVDNLSDVITENSGEGIDVALVLVSGYTIGANVEVAAIQGVGLTLTGNALSNVLYGASGADTLNGGDGDDTLQGGANNDTLVGGLGNDTFYVAQAGDTVVENNNEGFDATIVQMTTAYTLADNVEVGATFLGLGVNITGNGLDNLLYGNAGADTLNGAGGNDFIQGAGGNDTMAGGTGNDTYFIEDAGDVIIENANEGIDAAIVFTSSYTLAANVEVGARFLTTAYTLTGNALDNQLYGNNGNDTLNGGDGNDTIQGGGGNDTMVGGLGDDTYLVEQAGDVVTENANEGSDAVIVLIGSYTLAANVEVGATFLTTGVSITGNGLDNRLYGNSGADTLSGAGGADLLDGGAGADTLTGGSENDTFFFVAGQANGDTITDFDGAGAGAGDALRFAGYGTAAGGATFVQIDATHWQINSADGLIHDTITLANGASVDSSDWLFV